MIKDKHVIGEWDNIIEPGQKTKFTYEENELEFTLVGVQSHKKIVRKYLKDNKASVWEFDNFCLFIKEPVKEKKRNTGPLNPTSGMDPDIRAEYAKGEGGDKKQ